MLRSFMLCSLWQGCCQIAADLAAGRRETGKELRPLFLSFSVPLETILEEADRAEGRS